MFDGFAIDSELQRLGKEESVGFFRELLWAEASDTAVPRSAIHVPTRIDVPDGGLDATVTDASPVRTDLIPDGSSAFQIKSSGMSYSKWKNDVRDGDSLRPRIKSLLDDDGTYVLVIFEELVSMDSDHRDKNKLERWQHTIETEFAVKGYEDAAVRVYDTTRLAGFVKRFPPLVSRFADIDVAKDFDTWERTERVSDLSFVADDSRQAFIDEIQEVLRASHETCPVVRVTGLPGVGKTRLVYEALSPDDLKSRVLYVHAEDLAHSSLATRLQANEDWSAILVVDNCGVNDHEQLVRQFDAQTDRLALITISDEQGNTAADYSINLDPLDEARVVDILQETNPDVAEDRLERLAEFAQGFPRLAYLLSENIAADPSESADHLLQVADETPLRWLILGRDANPEEFREHKRVLEAFSLFEQVGWQTEERSLHPQAEWVASLAGFTGPDEMVRFREIVETQRNRNILQGEYYLAVQPLPLATYLLQSWWQTHSIEDVLKGMPQELLHRFGERIPFMATFDAGKAWISEILSPRGPFYQDDGAILDTELGSHLFFKLAEAAPIEAGETLQDILVQKSRDELEALRTGRRNIVNALEYIAVWEEGFDIAARLLLRLGEAENEDWANNASGIFAGLFSPGWGKLAPTEKPPEERLQIVEEALQSDSARQRQLGLDAAKAALTNPNSIVKRSGPEFQGARPTPNLWMPETNGDLFDYYRAVWNLLCDELPALTEEDHQDALEVLTGCIRGLATVHPSLSKMFREDLQDLTDEEWVDNRTILQAAVPLIEYDADELADINEQEPWEQFVRQLSEGTYDRLLRRYVGLSLISDRDVYEDRLEELAEESMDQPAQLKSWLSWLVTTDPNQGRVYDFGRILSEHDTKNRFLDAITAALTETEDPSVRFLAGYLAMLTELQEDVRQEVLDALRDEEDLQPLLVDLIRLSGMTTADARFVVDALRSKIITPEQLHGLETGGVSRNIDEPVFRELCEYLLYEHGQDRSRREQVHATLRSVVNYLGHILPGTTPIASDHRDPRYGARVLLPIFFHYYVYPDDGPILPKDLTIDLLTDPAYTEPHDGTTGQHAHEWKEIAQELIEHHPDTRDTLIDVILTNFGARNVMVGIHREAQELLRQMLADDPANVWPAIADALEQRNSRSVMVAHWLSGDTVGDGTPITAVDPADIWAWVNQDPQTLAPMAARAVPADLFHSDDRVCLAREVLARYGNVDGVQDTLSANFGTESWVGPGSQHHEQEKQQLEAFKQEEDNESVLEWINTEIADREQQIRSAEQFEERLGR